MAIEEMFTELPTVSNSLMSDIICAVQGYVSPSSLGLSTQQTLSQIFSLFQSNIILFNSGDPNGSVAGTTYQFCWDTLHSTLYICVTSGTTSTAVWIRADINDGYTNTATAAGTTTLTILSTYWQFFSGITTQTVVMPVASTLAAGMTWRIVNTSSGVVTVQSSGLNTIIALNPGQSALVTCILNAGTSAASWYASSTSSPASTVNSAASVTTAAGVPVYTSTMTNGQLVIGSTGATPTAAALTAGANISITNGPGSISIAATGLAGFSWTTVTGTSQAMLANNGYIANNVGLVTLTLPATSAVGSEIDIIGKGAGGWKVQCGGGQTIVLGSSTTTSGGSVASTQAKDSFYMICTVADTEWTIASAPQSTGLTIA